MSDLQPGDEALITLKARRGRHDDWHFGDSGYTLDAQVVRVEAQPQALETLASVLYRHISGDDKNWQKAHPVTRELLLRDARKYLPEIRAAIELSDE